MSEREVPARPPHYEPAAAVSYARALRWVPYAVALSVARTLAGASHEDLRLRGLHLSGVLSGTFFDDNGGHPAPFSPLDRFPEESLYVCPDRPPLSTALQHVNRALMQVAVKDASHPACDWYFDVVRNLMELLVDDGQGRVGSPVVGREAFEAAFSLRWVPE